MDENEKARNLPSREPDDNGDMVRQSTLFWSGTLTFFVAQPFSRFYFINCNWLEYWLMRTERHSCHLELLDDREGLFYDEANRYPGWFLEEK